MAFGFGVTTAAFKDHTRSHAPMDTLPARTSLSSPGHARWSQALLAVLILATALNLACLAVRVHSVATRGDLAMTTGDEEFSVYPAWKVAHDKALYEWPNRDLYSLTPYNFGFYECYGLLLRWLGQGAGAGLLLGGRLLTVLCAFAGAAAQYQLCVWLLGGRPGAVAKGFAACMALLVWIGTGFNAWNAVSIRPDVPGVALAIGGLLAYGYACWGRDGEPAPSARRGLLLAAAALFYAAWAFKQSLIWTFAGVCVHAALRAWAGRRWAPLWWTVLPVLVAVPVTLALGGEVYRFSSVRVQSLFVYSLPAGVALFIKTIVPNGLMWLFAPAMVLASVRSAGPRAGWLRAWLARRESPLLLAAGPALAFGVVALCKLGSGTAIMFESYALVSTLSIVFVAGDLLSNRGSAWTLPLATLATVFLLPVPALQLLLATRPAETTSRMMGGVNIGNLSRFTAAEYRRREALAAYLANLPKPIFIRDALFALPWYAGENRAPAFLIEPDVWNMFKRAKLIQGDGLAGFVRARYFATLLLSADDELYPVALAAGYQPREFPASLASTPDAYASDAHQPWRLLER
jgi:hypothetical protein